MALKEEPSINMHAKSGSLKDELTAALPDGFRCKVRYVHTAPKRCDPLFSTPPGHEPEITRLANHFLTVSIDPTYNGATKRDGDVLVLGIECLVYTTKRLTTIFVSKADSTGYLPQKKPSAIKVIATTFVHWLATQERHKYPTRKVVISLFARSQTQYLFPGSAENSNKHVLDDRQLIKWWVRVLDPIFTKKDGHHSSAEAQSFEYNGYITVPGYDGMLELRPFLPPHNDSSGDGQHWVSGNPLKELAKARGIPEDAPPRCLLPRFPDDPKARFMQDLDDEAGIAEDSQSTISPSKGKNGKWASVRDLHRFWEAMEFRQECSSGRVVGFIWLVISMNPEEIRRRKLKATPTSKISDSQPSEDGLSSDPLSQEAIPTMNGSSLHKRKRKPLTGPIIPRQPRLKGGSSWMTGSDLNGMLDIEAGSGLVLTQDGYDKAMHTLIHLDFANLDVATQSTNKWISEISQICGIQTDWALEIAGSAKLANVAKDTSTNGNLQVNQVNDLDGMIRKKRKAEDQPVVEGAALGETKIGDAGDQKPAVNVLGGAMIRKKPKPTT